MQTNFWTSGRYKAFHTTRTPLLFPGQLCTKGKKLSTKSTTIVQGSLTRQELHGSQQDQRGPIESELNEYGHRGRVLAPVIGRYGGASSDLSPILDLVAREMARKQTASYNIGISEAKALFRQKTCSQMASRNCSGLGDSSSGSPEGLRCSPLLCGRKLFF